MSEKYKGIKLPALRKVAEEKGLEGYEDLARDELIVILVNSDNGDKDPEENIEDAEGVEEDEASVEEKAEEAPEVLQPEVVGTPGVTGGRVPVGSKAEKMRDKLALQPKVRIMIPRKSEEAKGITESVILNGYRINIRKGSYVDVPESVAKIIFDAQEQTEAATEEMKRLDGNDMKFDGEAPKELI